MECTFEQFIEETKKVLRETDQLSKDVEELLRSYGGMQALKKAFKASSDGGRKNALKLKVVCEEIVKSAYITTKNKAAVLSTTIKKVGPHKANIKKKKPRRSRNTMQEFRGNFTRLILGKRHNLFFFFCIFVCFGFVFAAANVAGHAVQCSRASAAGGLGAALYQLYYLYGDYNKCTHRCKKLESMLNLLKSDTDKREVDKEGVDEKMELMKIS